MIFNSRLDIYQPNDTFEHGEVTKAYTLLSDQPLYCHLKFTGGERLSGDKQTALRKAKMTYEHAPVTLTTRDVVKIGVDFFRLLYPPMSRYGLSNRRFYEVEIVEAFDVEVV